MITHLPVFEHGNHTAQISPEVVALHATDEPSPATASSRPPDNKSENLHARKGSAQVLAAALTTRQLSQQTVSIDPARRSDTQQHLHMNECSYNYADLR
ncbi:hypothetical protein [Streptomyces sp. NPDC053542]|uniref:hypothetical protein n=1 Tax=Streptomyces sp. NPDC053542 TaxID=3365710 RepID=UPI0037D219A7